MMQNEIILKNVHLAFERFVLKAREQGVKENRSTVARRMSALAPSPMGDPAKTFRLLMGGKQLWKPELLKLFAEATKSPYEELLSPTYAGQESPDDDYPFYFKRFIRKELSVEQMKAVVMMLRRDAQRPGTFELVCSIHAVLVKSADVRTARDAVDDLLRNSSLWASKPAPASRKKLPN